MTHAPSIRDFLPAEAVAPIIKHSFMPTIELREPDAGYYDCLEYTLPSALSDLIAAHCCYGRMTPPPEFDGHASERVEALERLIEGDAEKHDAKYVANWFVDDLLGRLLPSTVRQKAEDFYDAYDLFCDMIDNGNFEVGDRCLIDGKRYVFSFDGWECQSIVDTKAVPVEPLPREQTHGCVHRTLDVVSNELLVIDRLRIPELDRLLPGGSVSTEEGVLRYGEACLEQLGLLTTFVGNMSPSIVPTATGFSIDNRRIPDEVEPDTPEFESHKDAVERHRSENDCIITDVWWVTIADPEKVVQVLSQHMPEAEAREALDRALEKEGNSITRLPCEPGTHHFYIPANSKALLNACDIEGVDGSCRDVYAVFSDRELDIELQPSPDEEIEPPSPGPF